MTGINSSVSQKYDLLSRFYDFIWRHYTKKTIGKAIVFADLRGREAICDVGCGTGALEKRLLELHPGLTINACDISVGMIARAMKKLEGFSQVTFYTGDFLRTAVEKQVADVVFSLSNLHYFSDPVAVLQRAAEIVKPGGTFVLVDWVGSTFRGQFYQFWMRIIDQSFKKAYSLEELRGFFEMAGWTLEAEESFSVRGFWTMVAIRARLKA